MIMSTDNSYVLFNLTEAAEELAKAIADLEADDRAGFEANLVFTYRKLNRAWNSRHLTPDELRTESSEEFERRCVFPVELSDLICGL